MDPIFSNHRVQFSSIGNQLPLIGIRIDWAIQKIYNYVVDNLNFGAVIRKPAPPHSFSS